jgi:hypothetical protein
MVEIWTVLPVERRQMREIKIRRRRRRKLLVRELRWRGWELGSLLYRWAIRGKRRRSATVRRRWWKTIRELRQIGLVTKWVDIFFVAGDVVFVRPKGDDDGEYKNGADRSTRLQAQVPVDAIPDASVKVQGYDAAPAAPITPSKKSTASSTEAKEKDKDIRGDRGYHPAELHPYTPHAPSTPSNNLSPQPASSSSPLDRSPSASLREKHGHGHGHFHVHQRTVSNASGESGSMRKKKVGFFDKVRGEAKVIVGKIEHKKEKVEEGKRILHGED